MTEKRLALSLFFLFALSAAYLIAVNLRGTDPNGKNWWNLSFTEPTVAASFSFTVANYTNDATFRYTVTQESITLDSGEFSVPSGLSQNIEPNLKSEPVSGRITVTVQHLGKEQTIYRSL